MLLNCDFWIDFLLQSEPEDQGYWQEYLNQTNIRNLIKVGNHTFNNGSKVESYMKEDIMKSVKYQLVDVLKNDYKSMFVCFFFT